MFLMDVAVTWAPPDSRLNYKKLHLQRWSVFFIVSKHFRLNCEKPHFVYRTVYGIVHLIYMCVRVLVCIMWTCMCVCLCVRLCLSLSHTYRHRAGGGETILVMALGTIPLLFLFCKRSPHLVTSLTDRKQRPPLCLRAITDFWANIPAHAH